MIKTHFTVRYLIWKGAKREAHYVLGVTSIVPNMNGILMFTQDGRNHFIESYELKEETLRNILISYDPIYEEEFSDGEIVHDHRAK